MLNQVLISGGFYQIRFQFDPEAENRTYHKLPQLFQRCGSNQKRSGSILIQIQIPDCDLSPLLQYTNIKVKFSLHCGNSNAVLLRAAKLGSNVPRTANFTLRWYRKNVIA
jgi:hypothetical protein